MPFHIVINESHICANTIKMVKKILERIKNSYDLKKVIICLENNKKTLTEIEKDHNYWFKYFILINQIAHTVDNVDSLYRKMMSNSEISSLSEKLSHEMLMKLTMYSTFGFERQQCYSEFYNFVKENDIMVRGIDTLDRKNYISMSDQLFTDRNADMARNLSSLKSKGYSTITIVGANHFFKVNTRSLYEIVETSSKEYDFFFMMKEERVIKDFSYFTAGKEELESELPTLQNIQHEMNIKQQTIFQVTNEDNAISSIYAKILERITGSEILDKYKLTDKSTLSLERGLRMAAANNGFKDLKLFIDLLVDINAQDSAPNSKKTALHHAASNRYLPCVKALLDAGANPTIKDFSGKTASDYVTQTDNLSLAILKLLNDARPSPSANLLSSTGLFSASNQISPEVQDKSKLIVNFHIS